MFFDKISTILGLIKMYLYKTIYFNRVFFKFPIKIKGTVKILVDKHSKIIFGKNVKIRYGSILTAERGGKISIGNNVFINDNAHITSLKSIIIKDNVHIGQNLVILDHDHDYRNNFANYITKDIVIEENVWIGANVTILKGVKIGKNSVIAAGTLVNKDVKENTVIYDSREKGIRNI